MTPLRNVLGKSKNIIIWYDNLCFVFAGDQEQSDADRRAASQVCSDSMNSYAHSGMSRTPDSFLNYAH